MKIAIINKKGGTGKTPIALSIAIDLKHNIATNDTSVLGFFSTQENHFFHNRMTFVNDEEMQNYKMKDNEVFDFGGWTPKGALKILEQCDKIIIPCSAENPNSVLQTASTIAELSHLKAKCIVVITMFEKEEEFSKMENQLKEVLAISIVPLKKSKIFNNVILKGQSIKELFQENSVTKYQYRGIYPQYIELLSSLRF